jgi:DOPA 4,5-dioxygenase
MTLVASPAVPGTKHDLKTVVESRTREWHFHIYFLLQSPTETAAALALRDSILRLRRDGKFGKQHQRYYTESLADFCLGAFVAVPLYRVNEHPMGPHPAGSYESE